jgi:hypothetical protein
VRSSGKPRRARAGNLFVDLDGAASIAVEVTGNSMHAQRMEEPAVHRVRCGQPRRRVAPHPFSGNRRALLLDLREPPSLDVVDKAPDLSLLGDQRRLPQELDVVANALLEVSKGHEVDLARIGA